MNIFMKMSFKGSDFYGTQKLSDYKTVQEVLEETLSKVLQKPITVKIGSRLDRGVSALDFGANFKLDSLDCTYEKLRYTLNRLLAPFIFVKELFEVNENFNARYDAVKKTYLYVINIGNFNPILKDLVYQPIFKPNFDKLLQVSKIYEGIHDFDAFGSEIEKEGKLRVIDSVTVEVKGNFILWRVEGRSFYRYQVRYMVGTALEVAMNRLDEEEITSRLNGENKITCHTKAPAHGLYLEKVEYDFERSENYVED